MCSRQSGAILSSIASKPDVSTSALGLASTAL
jgi:hypothetical protein